MGSRFTVHTARHVGRCTACSGDIIRGDTVGTYHAGRSRRIVCGRCARAYQAREATALDHRIALHRAAHATQAPAEPDADVDPET